MKGRRIAAIDLGSNSARLLVVEGIAGGRFRVLDDEKVTTRIARGLARTGRLDGAAMDEAVRALRDMRDIARGYGVRRIAGIATSAVREAKNGRAFLARLRAETGIRLRAIGGEEEARLAFRSALLHFPFERRRVAVCDLGGGSLEIAFGSGSRIDRVVSLDLGAVVLTERYLGDGRPRPRDLRRLERRVRRTLDQAIPEPLRTRALRPEIVVASGGTLATIARILSSMRDGRSPDRRVHGAALRRSEVRHLLDFLASCDPEARRNVPGLSADRADIVTAGVCVVAELFRALAAEEILVNGNGIREGLVSELLGGAGPGARADGPRSRGDLRLGSARAFASACGRESAHLEQVARLALSLFDATRRLHRLADADREVLEAAAVLHDVGYLIGHEDHHKHSYHLIRHADLRGFSSREIEILANTARYYRGRTPRKRHESFGALPGADRAVVRRLAALLRIADGLDRSRRGAVRAIEPVVDDGTLRIRATTPTASAVDLAAARRRADLFEAEFGVPVRIVRARAARGRGRS